MEITLTYHSPRAFLKPYILAKTQTNKFCHNGLKLLALSTHPAVSRYSPFRIQSLLFHNLIMDYGVKGKFDLSLCPC